MTSTSRITGAEPLTQQQRNLLALETLKALPLTDMAAAIREALFDRSYSYGYDQIDAGLDRIIAEDDGPGIDIRRTSA